MKKILTISTLVAIISLTGCAAPPQTSQVYRAGEVGVAQNIRYGTVVAARSVVIDAGTTGIGVGTGAILGGFAGSTIGHGNGSILGGLLGAVAGGVAGQAVERNTSQKQGVELTVKLDRGPEVVVVQPADGQYYTPGSRVRLIGNAGNTRVTF